MNETNDGGSAFPMVGHEIYGNGSIAPISTCGMSLRDWFAGQALAGGYCMMEQFGAPNRGGSYDAHVARVAYDIADAMIAQRG